MKIKGELEIDNDRGVIYFHCKRNPRNIVTLLRICNLPKIPKDVIFIDITHGVNVNYEK